MPDILMKPYPGVPKNLWPKMERCVDELMAKPDMKDKYPDPKERKSHAIAICHTSLMGKTDTENNMKDNNDTNKAEWSTAYVNDLPDSSFAYISPGGKKDKEGKTVPRSLRHLPYKDKNGKVDAAHVRNALARLNQTDIPAEAKASAKSKLIAAAKQVGIDVSDGKTDKLAINEEKGGENLMSKKTVDEIEKNDNVAVEEPKEEAVVTEEIKEEKPVEAPAAPAAPATPSVEKPAETAEPAPEAKPEEELVKDAEDAGLDKSDDAESEKADSKGEEEEKKLDEADAEKGEAANPVSILEAALKSKDLVQVKAAITNALKFLKAEKPDKEEDKEEEEKVDGNKKIEEAIAALDSKLDEIKGLVKQAPAEGAADEETPKKEGEPEGEKPAEEPKVEPEKVEPKEEKADKVDSGASSEGAKEDLLKALKDIKERLLKIENSPAPSKVVFSKNFVGQDESAPDLAKINARLEELTKKRDSAGLSDAEVDEALTLVKQKKALR